MDGRQTVAGDRGRSIVAGRIGLAAVLLAAVWGCMTWPEASREEQKQLAKSAGSGKKRPPGHLPYGIQDLRRAVIWAEILAPPLALRDR